MVVKITLFIVFAIAGTAAIAIATDSSSAAAKSEVQAEKKPADEDDKGGWSVIVIPQHMYPL